MRLGILLLAPFVLQITFYLEFCTSSDTITSSQFIQEPEFIVSGGGVFKLGFFNPVNSANRYVGIWFNDISIITPVWVANRDKPLNDSSGILKISEDGNLVVLNGKREVIWSTNLTSGVYNSSAVITDDGDLVLQDNANGNNLWESFLLPFDTLFANIRLSTNPKKGTMYRLTSWKSASDPSIGSFYAGIDASAIPEGFIWKDGGIPYWRSGPWVGQMFIGISGLHNTTYLDGYNLVQDQDGNYFLRFSNADESSLRHLFLDSDGKIRERLWDAKKADWVEVWISYQSECDVYGKCGEFGFCNPRDTPICSCLRGFEPKNPREWNDGNWSGGCVRRTSLQCERISNGTEVGEADGFLRLQAVKVPYLARWSSSTGQDCKDKCLNNCSCLAYSSYYAGFDCMTWSTNLIDIQQFTAAGADLYVRLAYSELGKRKNFTVIISLAVVVAAATLAMYAFFSWKWMARHREIRKKRNELLTRYWNEAVLDGSDMSEMKLQELPMFPMHKLVTATNNFDMSNKLGQGGFGPVYKGILSDGKEIAVKRLSRSSGQGLEEFMNEVKVISKLQHRNLVRLLGCCVEGEEKMLVYEFMPHKSLDAFLFVPHKAELLDWPKRFNIVEEICRGLLYLHRDSRLRIIHRDLKPSNILLDQELNPKISDFGMARIFGGNEDQANTQRVVGTYGYMSPEYLIKGQFSEKSDVFSLGVIILEIVSGKRNTSFRDSEQPLSFLGFAWKLWTEGNISTLIDPVVSHPRFREDVLRCTHVGLLCVQDRARDRPSISTVISMLNSEHADLPSPKHPAFTESLITLDHDSLQPSQGGSSINRVTVTAVEAR